MLAIFLNFIFIHVCAWGFDSYPEYQSLIDSRRTDQVLNAIDSEYSSDVLQFSPPITYFTDFESSEKRLDLSFGSLNGKQFLIQQRLKLEQQLNQDWHFKLNGWQHGDYDQNSTQFLWGLSRSVTPQLRFGLIGNAYFEKSKNDLGFEFTKSENKNSLWQMSYLRPDFQRNSRSDTDERWGVAPQLLSIKYFNQGVASSNLVFIKIEPHQSKYWVGTNESLSAKRTAFGWAHIRDEFRLQLQSDFKNEVYNNVKSDSAYTQTRIEKDFNHRTQSYTYGTGYFYRRFQMTSHFAEFHDVLPFIWWHKNDWSLGYDLTIHNAQDSGRISKSAYDDQLENRLNAKWRHPFSKQAELNVLFSFDLDQFGGSKTWEGGAANFVATF